MDLKLDKRMIVVLAVIIVVVAAVVAFAVTRDDEKPRFDVTFTEYTDAQHGVLTDAEGKDVANSTINVDEGYVYTLTITSKDQIVDQVVYDPADRVSVRDSNTTYDEEKGEYTYVAHISFTNGDAFSLKYTVSFKDPYNKLVLTPYGGEDATVRYTIGGEERSGEIMINSETDVVITVTSSQRPIYVDLGEVPEGFVKPGVMTVEEKDGTYTGTATVKVIAGQDVTLTAVPKYSYTVTIEEYKDTSRPDVTIKVTDSEGKDVTGTVELKDDATYKVTITTEDKTVKSLGASPSDRVKIDKFVQQETVDGFVYTAEMTVSKGAPITVRFAPVYSTSIVTLGQYQGAEGEKLVYSVDGKDQTSPVTITEDTVFTVTLTSKDKPTGMTVECPVEDAMTVTEGFKTSSSGGVWTSTVKVTVKVGTDATITAKPEFKMDVTIEAFKDSDHNVTVEVTKDGKPVTGKTSLNRGDELDLRVVSDIEIKKMNADPSDRVSVKDFKSAAASGGYTYTGKVVLTYGDAMTVKFDPEYAIYDLTLSEYKGDDGVQVSYTIDGKPVTGTYKMLKDTKVVITVTSPRVLEDIGVNIGEKGTFTQTPSGSKIIATVTVTVKTGSDQTLTVDPKFPDGQYNPSFLGIIAPEGVGVSLNGITYHNGDLMAITAISNLGIESELGLDMKYVITYSDGDTEKGDIIKDKPVIELKKTGDKGTIGTLRIGVIEEGTVTPGYQIDLPSSVKNVKEVHYYSGKELGQPYHFTQDVEVTINMNLDEGVNCVYIIASFEDGTIQAISNQIGDNLSGRTIKIGTMSFNWEHGNADVSIIPILNSDETPAVSSIDFELASGISVSYNGSVFTGGSLKITDNNSIGITTELAGTISYSLSWGDRTITGTSTSFAGGTIELPKEISEIALKLGSGTLKVEFTPMVLQA